MRLTSLRLTTAVVLTFLALNAATAANLTLSYIGQQIVPTGQTFQGTTIGGLSGIDYDASTQTYFAISDDRSGFNPARYYTLGLDLALFNRNPAPGQAGVSFASVTTIQDIGGAAFGTNQVDPEAIRKAGSSLFWTSEGERLSGNLQNPLVREMALDGSFVGEFAVPMYYNPAGAGVADPGIRRNLAFESLSFSNDGVTLYTATENALVQDGLAATTTDSSPSRILAFNASTGSPVAEYVYQVETVAAPPVPAGSFATNGLVEILNIPGMDGQLLTIERSFSTGVGNAIRLYLADLTGATNVVGDASLAGDAFTSVSKSLVLDLASLTNNDNTAVLLDNIEGVTWGPLLPNGNRSLILVSDNNFSGTQFTQFIAFEVVPEPASLVLFGIAVGVLFTRRK